jgi:hypothetical protein
MERAKMNIAVRNAQQVARPLKVLVPLIQEELIEGAQAGMEHYIKAGRMLNEVKDSDQVPYGSWGRWLKSNFTLSQKTAIDYMRIARIADEQGSTFNVDVKSLDAALGREPRTIKSVTKKNKLKSLFDGVDKVNVTRLADERQSREDEVKLHRELALQIIDLGYRAMATRLHPDAGGSRDAMSRLNTVRHDLKEFAATRRFV